MPSSLAWLEAKWQEGRISPVGGSCLEPPGPDLSLGHEPPACHRRGQWQMTVSDRVCLACPRRTLHDHSIRNIQKLDDPDWLVVEGLGK